MVCLLRYSNQLNVEDERGAAGDARLGEFAVAHLGRNVEFPLVTDVHLLKGDDPSVNQVAETACHRNTVTGGVEILAVNCSASIVDSDNATGIWRLQVWHFRR